MPNQNTRIKIKPPLPGGATVTPEVPDYLSGFFDYGVGRMIRTPDQAQELIDDIEAASPEDQKILKRAVRDVTAAKQRYYNDPEFSVAAGGAVVGAGAGAGGLALAGAAILPGGAGEKLKSAAKSVVGKVRKLTEKGNASLAKEIEGVYKVATGSLSPEYWKTRETAKGLLSTTEKGIAGIPADTAGAAAGEKVKKSLFKKASERFAGASKGVRWGGYGFATYFILELLWNNIGRKLWVEPEQQKLAAKIYELGLPSAESQVEEFKVGHLGGKLAAQQAALYNLQSPGFQPPPIQAPSSLTSSEVAIGGRGGGVVSQENLAALLQAQQMQQQ